MKVYPLSLEEMTETKATHAIEITYADFTGTGATQTLSPVTVADKTGFEVVAVELQQTFVSSDATLISTTITIGDGGSATRFLSSTELNAEGTEIFLKGGTLANTSLP